MPEYIVLRSSGKQATEDAPRREKISRRIWNSDDHFGRRNPAALSGVAGTVAGDDTIMVLLRKRSAGRELKELLRSVV